MFFIVLLNPVPSNWNYLRVHFTCFWQLHLLLGHMSCNFKKTLSSFKSHQAAFPMLLRCLCLQFPFFSKICPRVIHFLKTSDLLPPHTLQLSSKTLTSFWVFGFTFSCTFWFTVSLWCLPQTQRVFDIHLLKIWKFWRRSTRFTFNDFYLSSTKQNYLHSNIIIHIILAEKKLSLIFWSGELVFFFKISPNTS